MSVLREALFSFTKVTEVSIRTKQSKYLHFLWLEREAVHMLHNPRLHAAICAFGFLEKTVLDGINLLLSTVLQETECSPKADNRNRQFLIFFMCVGIFACVCLCTTGMPSAWKGQKKALAPLELELPWL